MMHHLAHLEWVERAIIALNSCIWETVDQEFNAFNAHVKVIKTGCLVKHQCKIILLVKSQSKYLADQQFD